MAKTYDNQNTGSEDSKIRYQDTFKTDYDASEMDNE